MALTCDGKRKYFGPKMNNFGSTLGLPPPRSKHLSQMKNGKLRFSCNGVSWFCWFLLACAGDAGFCRLLLVMPVMLASTGDTGDAGDAGYTF